MILVSYFSEDERVQNDLPMEANPQTICLTILIMALIN